MIGWLTVVCSAAILVAADLPRGHDGNPTLRVLCWPRDQQPLARPAANSFNADASYFESCHVHQVHSYTLPLLQCVIKSWVQASHILNASILGVHPMPRVFIDSASRLWRWSLCHALETCIYLSTNQSRVQERDSRVVSIMPVAL